MLKLRCSASFEPSPKSPGTNKVNSDVKHYFSDLLIADPEIISVIDFQPTTSNNSSLLSLPPSIKASGFQLTQWAMDTSMSLSQKVEEVRRRYHDEALEYDINDSSTAHIRTSSLRPIQEKILNANTHYVVYDTSHMTAIPPRTSLVERSLSQQTAA